MRAVYGIDNWIMIGVLITTTVLTVLELKASFLELFPNNYNF